jgi:cyanate permease
MVVSRDSIISPLDPDTDVYSFYINLPVGGLSAILIFFFFKTPPQAVQVPATRKEKFLQMDPLGIALIMGTIISFILATEYGGQKHAWDSAMVIGLLVGFVLILFVFVAWEIYNGERAMLPRRILSDRTVWQPSLFQFFFSASYLTILYYLPIYFQSIDNRTAISSGVLNLPLVIALALGSVVSGGAVSKTGHAAPFMMAGAILATVSGGLIYTFDIGTGTGKWIGYQIIYGAAIGLGFQMGINVAQANAKIEDMSSVTATIFCKLFPGNLSCQHG